MSEQQAEPQPNPKRQLAKTVRNVLLSAFVLLVLVVTAGLLYTKLSDSSNSYLPSSHTSSATNTPIQPTKPSPKAQEGVAVDEVTSPVSLGTVATVAVTTEPTSNCTITFTVNNTLQKAPGLGPQTADSFGSASWNWTIAPTTPLGTWPVKVACTYNKKVGVYDATIQVVK